MRVLIVSAYPPDPSPEANHAYHISEQLANLGYSVHVLCTEGGAVPQQSGIVVHSIARDWSWSDLPRIITCLRDCRPDVVLLIYIGWVFNHHPMITFLPTICKIMSPRVPCVTQFEIIDGEKPARSLTTRVLRKAMTLWAGGKEVDWLFGTLLRDSARTIVLSSPHRDRLTAHHPDSREKAIILPPPPLIRVTQDPPQLVRKRLRSLIGAGEDDFVLVYWGYIYPGKGLETLFQAFRLVCFKDSHVRLVLVGGKLEITGRRQACIDYFDKVQRLPDELGIADKVSWTGNFNWNEDTGSQYLYAGDACVLPFDYGITLNNSSLAAASSHGLPVISTELSKGRDEGLEHGQNIYLCSPQNPQMLAEAIQLIREDVRLRDRLRRGGLGLAREWYTWGTTSKRLAAILESAASSSHDAASDMTASSMKAPPSESDKQSPVVGFSKNGKWKLLGEHHTSDSEDLSREYAVGDAAAPFVSIIVAAHNVDRYLPQSLDALVNQTLRNIEIIVVNDASSDRCAEIIDEYKSAYPSLKIITCSSNKGLASVRNIGLRAATGQYVAFADGDDWVDVKMCEVLYRHAKENRAEVVIADATVFSEDTKTFGHFFDQHVRQTLDPRLRTATFGRQTEPRVLLLEPVAWSKLYERAFLQQHAIQFEDGMNSYEDICFHFSVLLKAKRICLIDDRLFYYRQNRPGQISGRTSRKIFEVFAVFNKIHENLTAWKVDPGIWAILTRIQVRQFNWLLKDRVHIHHKREFLTLSAKQLRAIPNDGFRNFIAQATDYELAAALCMRRNWLYPYEKLSQNRWRWLAAVSLLQRDRLSTVAKRIVQKLRESLISIVRSVTNKLFHVEELDNAVRTANEKLDDLTSSHVSSRDFVIEVARSDEQVLFIARPANSSLREALWRVKNDYYLLQTAVFREGDTLIDIGAHLGVVAISLAKRFPYLMIYAVEPNPMNYACLKLNIELNGVANVIPLNKAVSGDGRKRLLYMDASDNGWSTVDSKMASTRHVLNTAEVDTLTLDQLFHQYQIAHCRALKITAPGAIQESLCGFMRTGTVDLLCGEVDFGDCSRVQLEAASWRIARQHFWRTTSHQNKKVVRSYLHRMPGRIETIPRRVKATTKDHPERGPIEPTQLEK
jgi:FkbM family methyltransferase